ncbi:methyltransferase domain-containing protein [Lactarius psammicola]|nr:methyltransferase domain-containing protein [Lactarius psammicola]
MAPRTTRPLLLTVIALVSLSLFFWVPSFGFGTLYYRDPYNSHVASLAARLRDEETRYAATLKAREGLIKKHGPSKEQIEAYPTTGSYTIWDFFIPSFQCPHHVERIGVLGDGGKWVCGVERIAKQEKCVIYSFGINGESSFEAALLERAPGCEVWGYDFTVNSFGPEIEETPSLKERAHFFPWALGGRNAHGPEDAPKYYTLDALMQLNGHSFIDVLKIDIEGAEFDTLTTFLAANKPRSPFTSTTLPIGQLQIELHAWDDYEKFGFFHDWWAALETAGLRPFWTESNLVYVNYNPGGKPRLAEYSFMNIRGNHSLVYEPADGGVDAY